MKLFSLFLKFFLFIFFLLFFYFAPSLLQKPEKSKTFTFENKNKKQDISFPAKFKISSPKNYSEFSEFEKTKDYEKINCKNPNSNPFFMAMIKKINIARQNNGEKPLSWSIQLCQSATAKANHMIENNYFAHISPTGITPWYWIKNTGYKYLTSGENLAMNYFTAESSHEALMNSKGHRENILKSDFTEVGLSYARGKIDNDNAFIVVQHFGSPAKINYICEIEKANKDLKKLKEQKQEINEYLNKAHEAKDNLEENEEENEEILDNLKEYIDDLEENKLLVKKYIANTKEYLQKCDF